MEISHFPLTGRQKKQRLFSGTSIDLNGYPSVQTFPKCIQAIRTSCSRVGTNNRRGLIDSTLWCLLVRALRPLMRNAVFSAEELHTWRVEKWIIVVTELPQIRRFDTPTKLAQCRGSPEVCPLTSRHIIEQLRPSLYYYYFTGVLYPVPHPGIYSRKTLPLRP